MLQLTEIPTTTPSQSTGFSRDHKYKESIKHKDLYLWDVWSYEEDQILHLYCLATGRVSPSGKKVGLQERNQYPFFWWHFTSNDFGKTWKDVGICLERDKTTSNAHDSQTIWSGSVKPLPNGLKLAAYTGLYEQGENHKFLQNLAFAVSKDGYNFQKVVNNPVLCPRVHYDWITSCGYFLGPKAELGYSYGEEGGPIMAWRDPYIYVDSETEEVHLFWGAKARSSKTQEPVGVLGHATLDITNIDAHQIKIKEMSPPIFVPDSDHFTQLELPNVFYDPGTRWFYLLVSTTNREDESQPDAVIDKRIRLYRSRSLTQGWEIYGTLPDDSIIVNPETHLFGLAVLQTSFSQQEISCIGSYTGAIADLKLAASICKPFSIDLERRKSNVIV